MEEESQPSTEIQPHQSDFVQLVDEKGLFNDSLDEYLRSTGFSGIDYHVLAVFGCQSSGKSTLLNRLFATKFPVMDSSRGRHQTTKGIVASRATQTDIFVLDMEGTDSKERGEANTNFERKTSLFALAMAEVLIVNMWVQDIGRYNASNYSLLKTVFELNLQLFAKERSGKMLLHFVIRDLVDTPPETLQDQLLEDINALWTSLIKPEEFVESKPADFYDFSFFFLPHMRLAAADFEQGIVELRKRFVNTDNQDFVFKSNYRKPVPIDGFSLYASSIWETIQANKDLDIPTQKEMLAMYRCSEISKDLFTTEFVPHLENEWREQHSKNLVVKDLGKLAADTIAVVLEKFSDSTALYLPSVVEKMRTDLDTKMRNEVHALFEGQLQIIRKNALKAYDGLLQSVIPTSQDSIMTDFCEVTRNLQANVLKFFDDLAQSASLPDEHWDTETPRRQLIESDIVELNARHRHTQIERIIHHEKKAFAADLAANLAPILEDSPPEMWNHLRAAFRRALQLENTQLCNSLSGFEPAQHEIDGLVEEIRVFGMEFARSKVDDVASFLSIKMMKTFNDKFRFTDDHLPIVWKPRDNIKTRYIAARELSLQLLNSFFLFRLENASLDAVNLHFTEGRSGPYIPESSASDDNSEISASSPHAAAAIGSNNITRFDFPSSGITDEDVIVLNETECRRIFERFIVESEAAFADAERAQLQNSNSTRIPWWVFLLLLVFGWNEIMYVLTRPLLLATFLAIGVAVAVLFLQSQIEDWLQTGPPMVTIPINMVLAKLPFSIFPNTTSTQNRADPQKEGPAFLNRVDAKFVNSKRIGAPNGNPSSTSSSSSFNNEAGTRLRSKLVKQNTRTDDFQERMEEALKRRASTD